MATSDFNIEAVGRWHHRDAAFVVQLGFACGWTIHPNNSGGVRMFSQDGTQVTVPDNTSLNINVFRSWVSKVWRHRRTTVSPKQFEEIVGQSKIDKPHVKIAWTATALEPPTPLPEPAPERDDAAHREAADAVAALVDGPKTPYEPPAIESRTPIQSEDDRALAIWERTMYPPADGNRHGKIRQQGPNRYKKNKHGAAVIVSEHVIKREWSDGYIDYACADCGHVSKSPAGIGGHRVIHGPHLHERAVKAVAGRYPNSTPMTEDERKERKRALEAERHRKKQAERGAKREAAAEDDGPVMPPPPPAGPENILKQISSLLFPDVLAERDAAIARAEKAEGDLDALRDLLGVRK